MCIGKVPTLPLHLASSHLRAPVVSTSDSLRSLERLNGLKDRAVSRLLVEILIPEQCCALGGENTRDPRVLVRNTLFVIRKVSKSCIPTKQKQVQQAKTKRTEKSKENLPK